MNTCAIYVRVSTEEQSTEGFSINAQLKRLRAFCNSRGWKIFKEYVESGQSALTIVRPEYLRMMEESDQWTTLVVWKLDRIHRNAVNFSKMIDALQKAGKEFVSVYEKLDTTTIYGRFAADIISRMAQLESEQLGERVSLGMEQRVKKGKHNGPPPYGYKMEYGELIPAEGCEFIAGIYNLRYQGYSLDAIAMRLNHTVKSPKSKNWTGASVRSILSNPVYAGYVRFNGDVYKGVHEALIPLEIWEAVNGHSITKNKRLRYKK